MKVIKSKSLSADVYDSYVIALRNGRVINFVTGESPNQAHRGLTNIPVDHLFHSYQEADTFMERHYKTIQNMGDAFQIVGVLIETNGSVDKATVPNNQIKRNAWVPFEETALSAGQITLYSLVQKKEPLSSEQRSSLFDLLAKGCRQNTIIDLKRSLGRPIAQWTNFGVYSRVVFDQDGTVDYVAGQSYTDEIRTLRKCIIGNKG